MKLNVTSEQTFGMVRQGSRIQSIILVAGHQVIRNLSEPSDITMMHLDTYTYGDPRTKKLHGRYVEVYGPYQVMTNVDKYLH